MVKLRKILFVLFALSYLIVCPAVILYSLGIVIKSGKKSMVKTGVIYVTSVPSGAAIMLNGKLLNQQTPSLIDNLLPGEYTIRLNAPNYQSWISSVFVSAEQATPLENILLLPDPLSPAVLSETKVQSLLPIDDNPFLILTTGTQTDDVFIHLWDEGITQNILPERADKPIRFKPLFPLADEQYKGKVQRIFSVPGSPYLIFEIENNNARRYFWTDPLLGKSKIEEITDLFPASPEAISWSVNDPRHILSFQKNAVNRIDIATNAIYPRIMDHVIDYAQYGQTAFFLTEEHALKKTNIGSNDIDARPASNNPFFNNLILRFFPFIKITAVTDHVVILLGKNGELIGNLKPFLWAESGIKGFKWNAKPRKLLVWSKNAIGVLDFSQSDSDAPAPSVHWIEDTQREITNAFWANEGSHIIFAEGDQLKMVSANIYPPNGTVAIAPIKRNSDFYYSERTGKTYFISKDTEQLVSLDLIVRSPLLSTKKKDQKTDQDDHPLF